MQILFENLKHDEFRKLYDIGHDEYEDYEEKWYEEWMEHSGLEMQLKSESTIELQWDVYEPFGCFGFKTEEGYFAITPQYIYAYEFTNGLAAVNLNRTWYESEDGKKYYENHYGYINSKGKTVIPFKYDDAYPFNKYGVARVYDIDDGYMLIDMNGNKIPNTRFGYIYRYSYTNRFIAFSYEERFSNGLVGIYDTREKKILIEPCVDSILEINEECILLYRYEYINHEHTIYQSYINSKGQPLYSWLDKEKFNIIAVPDKYKVTAVGKKCGKVYKYGLYSSLNHYLLPLEYEKIDKLSDSMWACYKDENITVVQTELEDKYGKLYTLNEVEAFLNERD